MIALHGITQSIKRGGGIVTDGLVMHLDAGNAASYPGSGTTWTDLSGNGNHATLTNGPTFDSANGGSIVFDGSNDYAKIASTSFTIGTSATTICSWCAADSACAFYNIALSVGFGQPGQMIYVGHVGGATVGPANTLGGGLYGYNYGTDVDANNDWHYMCAVYDGGANAPISIYIDNVLKITATVPLNASTNISHIGSGVDGDIANYFFIGKVGTAEVYNRALSAAEIESNYNAIKGRYGL